MNFFLARVWVVTLYLLHQMVGRHLLEKPIPFLDKVPWPVRQKEASQVTSPRWQFQSSPRALVMLSGSYIAPLNPLCSVYTSAGGGDITSKSLCLQPN